MKKCVNSLIFLLVEDVAHRLVVNNKPTSNIGTGSQVDEILKADKGSINLGKRR